MKGCSPFFSESAPFAISQNQAKIRQITSLRPDQQTPVFSLKIWEDIDQLSVAGLLFVEEPC
jgi:hypothetical protein